MNESYYVLERLEIVAINTLTNEDVKDWIEIQGSRKAFAYPREELENKKNWRQIKVTITKEVV